MKNYTHRFKVKAPWSQVSEFHAQSASLGAITPPPAWVRLHHAPPRLKEGDQINFTIWLGPLPIRWLARIEEVNPTGFVDRQVRGPFQHWAHRHTFVPLGEESTEVVDEIEFKLAKHPGRGLVGLGMGLSLPLLFAYRGWKTRRLLKNQQLQPA
jgi:ligand-binding SRPBCC domain-containing protein